MDCCCFAVSFSGQLSCFVSVRDSVLHSSDNALFYLVPLHTWSVSLDMLAGLAPLTRQYGLLNFVLAQGKVAELRQELNSGGKKDKNYSAKKIALKKIVANMTMSNNDMVGLFPDVIGCMNLPSLEIKKMYVDQDSAGV